MNFMNELRSDAWERLAVRFFVWLPMHLDAPLKDKTFVGFRSHELHVSRSALNQKGGEICLSDFCNGHSLSSDFNPL